MKEPTEAKQKPWLWYGLGLGILILLMWGISIPIWWALGQLQGVGTFGDMFGAVNALFTGLAFAGIIGTLFLQRHDLEMQRNLLKLQMEEIKLQRMELSGSRKAQEGQAEMLQLTAILTARSAIIQARGAMSHEWEVHLAAMTETIKKLEQQNPTEQSVPDGSSG